MSDLRDFLCWFDGFAENIEKTPTTKQWAKIKERVAALRVVGLVVGPGGGGGATPKPAPPVKKPDPIYPFIIDQDNVVRNGRTKKPILPTDVMGQTIHDLRGMDGDLKTIVWADGATGLNGADCNIIGA